MQTRWEMAERMEGDQEVVDVTATVAFDSKIEREIVLDLGPNISTFPGVRVKDCNAKGVLLSLQARLYTDGSGTTGEQAREVLAGIIEAWESWAAEHWELLRVAVMLAQAQDMAYERLKVWVASREVTNRVDDIQLAMADHVTRLSGVEERLDHLSHLNSRLAELEVVATNIEAAMSAAAENVPAANSLLRQDGVGTPRDWSLGEWSRLLDIQDCAKFIERHPDPDVVKEYAPRIRTHVVALLAEGVGNAEEGGEYGKRAGGA